MILRSAVAIKGSQADDIIDQILKEVPVPSEERLWEREG